MQYVLNSEFSKENWHLFKAKPGLKSFSGYKRTHELGSLRQRGCCVQKSLNAMDCEKRFAFSALRISADEQHQHKFVSQLRCWSPSESPQPPAVRSWRSVSLKDEVWPSDTVTSSLTCTTFISHLSLYVEISLLRKSWEGWLAPESCNLAPDQSF